MMTDWSLAPVQERAMATVTEWELEVRRTQEDARSAAEMLRGAMRSSGNSGGDLNVAPRPDRMELPMPGTDRDSA
jgi:hypothetical protein